MVIDTGDAEPIRQKPYRIPYPKRKEVSKQIKTMLDAEIIQPSQSRWASPLVLVPKPDGSIRICIDYRKLNAVTKVWSYPIPHVDTLLSKLGGATCLSTLDLKSGYHQIKMAEESRNKTAFICDDGLFEYLKMPFGLCCAPAQFQQLMEKVLEGMDDYVGCYLDDIVIFSKTPQEHVQHLQKVFDRLRKYSLKMRKSKCNFFCDTIKYLGFIVDKDGFRPDPAKVEALRNLPTPSTVKEVRSFLGMTGYFRRFCPWYSKTALPLTNLTRKNIKFAWTSDCELAFRTLIDQLSNPPILAHPQIDKPYILYTDASKNCVGAMLTQEFPEGERPIYFLSHKLSPTQSKWPAVQAETYAIYFAVQKFRPFLYGSPKITVRTDHRPLQYLFTAELVNPSIQRWAIYLSEYNIVIEHIAGRENLCGDFLSRINWKNHDPNICVVNNVSTVYCNNCNVQLTTQEQSSEHVQKSLHAINLNRIDIQFRVQT